MAKTTLEVELIADTRKLDRALKGKKIGVGGAGKESSIQKKQTKDMGALVGISGKILGSVAIVAAVLSGLDFIIKPLAAILTAIMTLLFLPLIPVFKPALEAMAAFMPVMVKVSQELTKIVEFWFNKVTDGLTEVVLGVIKLFNIFKGFVKGVATLGLWVWEQIIKPGFESLLNVGERIFNDFLKPAFDAVKNGLVSLINGVIAAVNKILPRFLEIPTVSAGVIASTPNQSFPVNQSFPSSNTTLNFTNNGPIRNESDIKKIADQVSKVLASDVLRGTSFSL